MTSRAVSHSKTPQTGTSTIAPPPNQGCGRCWNCSYYNQNGGRTCVFFASTSRPVEKGFFSRLVSRRGSDPTNLPPNAVKIASSSTSQAQAGQTKQKPFGGSLRGSASKLWDRLRSKAGIRGSTPDSEVHASCDDEQDHHHPLQPVTSKPGPKPTRRPSSLNETQQAQNHQASLDRSSL